jgi:DeoR family fructose operon transcriptional repressor
VTIDRGLTTPDVDEARVKSAFVEKGRRVVALADHSKFGREDFAVIAPVHEVDAIITDTGLDAETANEITALGIEVRTA